MTGVPVQVWPGGFPVVVLAADDAHGDGVGDEGRQHRGRWRQCLISARKHRDIISVFGGQTRSGADGGSVEGDLDREVV
jgi:hypothetical protein